MLKAELKKLSFIPYLILSISGIVLLCLSATGETDMSGKQISIFSLMFQEQQANTDLSKSALALWQAGIGGWLVVFAPMLLSMGYILLISEERRNGQIRFHILRSGNWKYCISKLCSGALAGGIVFLIGYALFGLLMLVRFPSIRTFSAEEQEILLMGSNISVVIIKKLIGVFLYGMFGSVFGIGVAIVFRDKYMLVCLPFMIKYIYQQILAKMAMDAMAAKAYERLTWIETFQPENIMNISLGWNWFLTVILMLAIYAVLSVIFYRCVKRGDWGV
ncbi:hypothetical protein [Eubacterium ramulus]